MFPVINDLNKLPNKPQQSDQHIGNTFPHELEIKIFNFLPDKNLAISRLVSPIWRIFIDTHFSQQIFSRQYVFILQKYPIAKENKNYLSKFAIRQTAANDFEKALELEKNLGPEAMSPVDHLINYADSKEKILKVFNLSSKGELQLQHSFFRSIQPLIKRYFSIHASLKKDKQEAIPDNFNEALSVLKKFQINKEIHLLIGLSLVETYPEQAKNQQDAVFDSLKLKDDFLQYVEIRQVVEQFSLSTLLNFLVIAKFFPDKDDVIPYLFEYIKTREDALTFLSIGRTNVNVRKLIQYEKIYKHLNFFDLLNGADLLRDGEDTDQFYRTILKQAESAGEFEIGLRKFLERKPKEAGLTEHHRIIVSIILDETPTRHLSFGVYEMLLYYPDNASFARAFIRIASTCEKGLCKTIVDRVKRMEELNDGIRTDILELEIEKDEFEQAKQTFYSIKNPQIKNHAIRVFGSFIIEREDWDYFDVFFKESIAFCNQESSLIDVVARKDAKRAVDLAKSYWTGYQLASYLISIAKVQKHQKTDFLPLVFETRSLIISLVTQDRNADQALDLLKELLELQSDEPKKFL